MRGVPRWLLAAAAAFAVMLVSSHFRSTVYNNYALLANAFLHGHAWIVSPGAYIDALHFGSHDYVIEGPVPALLLLPLAALFGTAANQTLVAIVLAAVAIGAAWRVCELLEVSLATAIWLCAFLLAGTDLWWCAMLGDVWFIAHVSALCFTLLALAELLGKQRAWLVALFAVAAAGSRFSLALAVPVYAAFLLWSGNAERSVARARVFGFGSVVCGAAVVWIAYNLARWGTVLDIGYTTWYHRDAVGQPTGSPFRLSYLPYELQSFLLQGPTWLREFPYVKPELGGLALPWTSPALVLAAFARNPRKLVVAMWSAAVLVTIPSLLYYVNGFAQFGMRHALDFEPFLFVLMVLAARDRLAWWGKALIAYSAAVGIWGIWFWNHFYRATS